jgi:hypothetical protein
VYVYIYIGPDAHVVNSVSKSCSCMGEWLFNSLVFQSVVAVCVYVILNISRVLICHGAVMILWRSLTLQEFEVKSTYSYIGDRVMKRNFLSLPKDKNDSTKRLLNDSFLKDKKHTPYEITIDQSIKELVKVFVVKGYFYSILGFLINALWLTVLLQAQQNISYNPNK